MPDAAFLYCSPGCVRCRAVRGRSQGKRMGWALGVLARPLDEQALRALELHDRRERRLAAEAVADFWPHTAGFRAASRRPCSRCGGREGCAPRLAAPLLLGVTPDQLDGAPTLCDGCARPPGTSIGGAS